MGRRARVGVRVAASQSQSAVAAPAKSTSHCSNSSIASASHHSWLARRDRLAEARVGRAGAGGAERDCSSESARSQQAAAPRWAIDERERAQEMEPLGRCGTPFAFAFAERNARNGRATRRSAAQCDATRGEDEEEDEDSRSHSDRQSRDRPRRCGLRLETLGGGNGRLAESDSTRDTRTIRNEIYSYCVPHKRTLTERQENVNECDSQSAECWVPSAECVCSDGRCPTTPDPHRSFRIARYSNPRALPEVRATRHNSSTVHVLRLSHSTLEFSCDASATATTSSAALRNSWRRNSAALTRSTGHPMERNQSTI